MIKAESVGSFLSCQEAFGCPSLTMKTFSFPLSTNGFKFSKRLSCRPPWRLIALVRRRDQLRACVSPEPALDPRPGQSYTFVPGKFRGESASVGARRSKKPPMTVAA